MGKFDVFYSIKRMRFIIKYDYEKTKFNKYVQILYF